MKLIIETPLLAEAAQRIKVTTTSATTLPILQCMLLKAENGRLKLAGNNLDLCLETSMEAEVETSGGVALPGRRLADALRRFDPSVPLEIEANKEHVVTFSQNGQRTLKLCGLPEEEFPEMVKISGEAQSFTIGKGLLAEALEAVLPFVSTDASRYVINGVCFVQEDGKLRLVTTDGRRLRMRRLDLDYKGEMIVPTGFARLLQQLGKEEVHMRCSESALEALSGNWKMTGKLIEGNYPNWRQVVPSTTRAKQVWFERKAMLKALEFAEICASDSSYSVKLSVDKNSLNLASNTPDLGEAQVTVAGGKGDLDAAAYNPLFLRELVASFPEGGLTLLAADAMSPALMEDEQGLGVVMPMRIS